MSEPTWREPTWEEQGWYVDHTFGIASAMAVTAGQPDYFEAPPEERRDRLLLADELVQYYILPDYLGDPGPREKKERRGRARLAGKLLPGKIFRHDPPPVRHRGDPQLIERGAQGDPTDYLRSVVSSLIPTLADQVIAALPQVMVRRMWFLGARHLDQRPEDVGTTQKERVLQATGDDELAERAGAAATAGCERAQMELFWASTSDTDPGRRVDLEGWMDESQLEDAEALLRVGPRGRGTADDDALLLIAARLAVIAGGLPEQDLEKAEWKAINSTGSVARAAGGIDEALHSGLGLGIEPNYPQFMSDPFWIELGATPLYAERAMFEGLSRRHPTDGKRLIQDLGTLVRAFDSGLDRLRPIEKGGPEQGGREIGG